MPGDTMSAFTPSQAAARLRSATGIPLALGPGSRLGAVIPGDDIRPARAQRRDGRRPRSPQPEHGNPVARIALDRNHGRR